MKLWMPLAAGSAALFLFLQAAPVEPVEDQLARLRNLGKAFYENTTTQTEAVETFRQALKLKPDSVRERLNFGLALLRAGKTAEGIAELEKVQKADPSLPHTWFNLGIVFKKQGEAEKATVQMEKMVALVPGEPIAHYNLGSLYKLAGKTNEAIQQFETASRLNPALAAPHFQLYNSYRTTSQPDKAKVELETFQRLKKQMEGAAIPEDVEWCDYAEIYEVVSNRVPADKAAELKFRQRSSGPAADGMLWVDVNGDGKPKLLTWSAAGIRVEPAGVVADVKGVISVAAGDFNNDGLPDLCVLTAAGPQLLVNVKGKFQKFAADLPAVRFEKAVWLDFDHDYDLDLVLLGKQSMLFRNQGAAGFQDHTKDFPFAPGEALDAVPIRALADSKSFDLAVAYRDHAGVLYRDQLSGTYKADALPLPAGATQMTAVDIDNDGSLDLVFATAGNVNVLSNRKGIFGALEPVAARTAEQGYGLADLENRGVQDLMVGGSVLRNLGGRKFAEAKRVAVLADCRQAAVWGTEVGCLTTGGVRVLANETASGNQWIRVRLAGIKNLKTSPGAEVEVKAGVRYQKQVYQGEPLLFGLGNEKSIDTVRITWPNGLIQNEMKQVPGKEGYYKEAQRLSGSCPIIWTWNGTGFEYITDVLGVAPLGASAGEGQYFPVDHDEYIQIDGKSLTPVDGEYQVRITEELSEVAYLDHVRLIAVDHPSETAIYTNEKFKGPPFPEFRLFGVKSRRHAVRAADEAGRDVRAKLAAKDRTYPDGFSRTLTGVAQLHTLDLDFGREASPQNRAVLVLSGWVDWADGSTFLGVAQEGKGGLVPPYLQVKDERGKWTTVIEDMGMPAGKPKTIAVDLTGKFLSASREVRIVTNLCVYWDEIFMSEDTAVPPARQTVLVQTAATLRFRGFSPSTIDPERKQPEAFSYNGATPTSLWNPTPGHYTRYGDVRELAASVDDKMIVMGSGDELQLRFDAKSLAPVATGWTRDFLLLVDGWAKDRDANTAFSQTTDPLPFHSMSQFPYPASEHYPSDAGHASYRERYNTRSGLRLIRPLN
ncbi:MAG: tetratricopeptide repeat protein [Bryobacteraceae bacterium]